jgi:hypothetical protein
MIDGPRIFPIRLTTQRDFRELRRLPFCFLCGQSRDSDHAGNAWALVHLPPLSLFDITDRSPVLKLPCHATCHDQVSRHRVAATFLSISSDRSKCGVENSLRAPEPVSSDTRHREQEPSPGMSVAELIWWIRGFHAALYRIFLDPTLVRWAVHIPSGVDPHNGSAAETAQAGAQRASFVSLIENNRRARRLDQLEYYHGGCTYECVWARQDETRWVCVWSLDISGSTRRPQQSADLRDRFFGSYGPAVRPPPIASQETPVGITLASRDLLGGLILKGRYATPDPVM